MKKVHKNRIENMIIELETINANIWDILNDEQEIFDNKTDRMQDAKTGDKLLHSISYLRSAFNNVRSVVSDLNESL